MSGVVLWQQVEEMAGGKRADVLVGEVVNTGLIGEGRFLCIFCWYVYLEVSGILKSFNDAHNRLLSPNPIVIPRGAAVEAILIESEELLRYPAFDSIQFMIMLSTNSCPLHFDT